jgi:hypothetical protein
MKRIERSLLFVIAVLMTATAWAQSDTPRGGSTGGSSMKRRSGVVESVFRNQLRQAARQAGVAINSDSLFVIAGEGVTFVAASTAGFENVPVTALLKGVTVGFAYLDAPGSRIPSGFYTLRATAAAVQLGRFAATVELVSSRGAVAAKLPATVDAFSLSVPQPLPFAQTMVGGSLQPQDPRTRPADVLSPWFFCPNGWVFCFNIDILTSA